VVFQHIAIEPALGKSSETLRVRVKALFARLIADVEAGGTVRLGESIQTIPQHLAGLPTNGKADAAVPSADVAQGGTPGVPAHGQHIDTRLGSGREEGRPHFGARVVRCEGLRNDPQGEHACKEDGTDEHKPPVAAVPFAGQQQATHEPDMIEVLLPLQDGALGAVPDYDVLFHPGGPSSSECAGR